MSFISIGDLSGSFRLRHLNTGLKQDANRLSVELATGQAADPAAHLKGRLDTLGTTDRAYRMSEVYDLAATEFLTRASGMQAALDVVRNAVDPLAPHLLSAATGGVENLVKTAGQTALSSLKTVVGALNSQLAGQGLFAGQSGSATTLIAADQILDDLEAGIAGQTTAAGIRQVVDDYFNQPGGGFETTVFQGSETPQGPVNISRAEVATINLTAASPEIRSLLEGLSNAALLDRDVLAGNPVERGKMAKSAGETLIAANQSLIDLAAEIGAEEARVETVQTTNQARKTALGISYANMMSVDGYETATDLQRIETSLEALYISTSRLSQLSLTRYL